MKISKANKEKLMQRFKEQEEEAPPQEDFSFLEAVVPEVAEEEAEEELTISELSQQVIETFYSEGYSAFFRKLPITEFPVTEFEEDDQEIAKRVWEEGWFTACRDYFTAQTLLTARSLVDLLSAEDISEEEETLVETAIEDLATCIDQLSGVMDFDAYAAYWQQL